jgi:hypothetical protein
LKRVFKIDILTCEHCGGAVKVIASIEDPAVIKKILDNLAQRAGAATPVFRPFARASPQHELPGLKQPGWRQTPLTHGCEAGLTLRQGVAHARGYERSTFLL